MSSTSLSLGMRRPSRARFRFPWRGHGSLVKKMCKYQYRYPPELSLATRFLGLTIARRADLRLPPGDRACIRCGSGIDCSQLSATGNSGREVQMGRRNQILMGGAILGLGVALATRGAAPGTEVRELKVTIREWVVPTKGAHQHEPAVGPDGPLWLTL